MLTTARLRLRADSITINADIAEGGGIRAALLGADGSTITGFGMEDCLAVRAGGLACEIRWENASLSELGGDSFSLVLEIDNAKHYALSGLSRIHAKLAPESS